jgi:hypothetical protein
MPSTRLRPLCEFKERRRLSLQLSRSLAKPLGLPDLVSNVVLGLIRKDGNLDLLNVLKVQSLLNRPSHKPRKLNASGLRVQVRDQKARIHRSTGSQGHACAVLANNRCRIVDHDSSVAHVSADCHHDIVSTEATSSILVELLATYRQRQVSANLPVDAVLQSN